ncbi:MFS transporter [Ornithobacterium rhinotracheale]|uniref:MFS transporter n=1 Tax=Ornithobacterium rhinotracheale TaxID=28251 RepID=UPI00129CB551|nr:MFS transporter [Ornithobacterium rhinotracheale]MRJ09198.1 MFS transporter [Ornithobacterium rhinotracheale]UOH76997.1 MFS transporter [Ornithobacterium rhinotracheale]
MEKLKKQQFAWAFYDWANSVYSLVITTAIFPIYFGAVLSGQEGVKVFGIQFSDKDILYSYSITASFVIVVLLSPILSAISDQIGNKKRFLKIFSALGSFGCASLFFFTNEETLWIGVIGSIMASVGYWGSLVFYNAYLPEIADKEMQDKLSAQGFVYGYIGSAILLIFCLAMIMFVSEELTRYSFLLVALWWIGFAQYTFKNLPNSYTQPENKSPKVWRHAHRELFKVGQELFKIQRLKYYLLAFFFLSVGIQTINYMASRFGDEELGLDSNKLIIAILLIQFVAVAGSYLFAYLSKKMGNLSALQVGLVIWAGICVSAFLMHRDDTYVTAEFYALGAAVGLVLGGVQALCRSSYSKLLPKSNDNTIYFSFYDIVEKIALILGSFLFAQVLYLMGSMQYSALCLGIFFILAIIFLRLIKDDKN